MQYTLNDQLIFRRSDASMFSPTDRRSCQLCPGNQIGSLTTHLEMAFYFLTRSNTFYTVVFSYSSSGDDLQYSQQQVEMPCFLTRNFQHRDDLTPASWHLIYLGLL